MKKSVWITSLAKDEARVQKVIADIKKYALDSSGHFWADANSKLAWISARDELSKSSVAAWVILSTDEEIQKPSVRYGLSLLAQSVRAARGPLPIFVITQDAKPLKVEDLPAPLLEATVFAESSAWMAKLIAKTAVPAPKGHDDYYLDIYGNEQIGQWFELRPVGGEWNGVMFGVSGGAEINFQAVGPKGKLPEKSVLNLAQQGIKINVGDKEYTAWALRNKIDPDNSYFVRVKGDPDSILFGEFSEVDETEMFILRLV